VLSLFRTRQTLFNFFLLFYAAALHLRTLILPASEPLQVQGLFSYPLATMLAEQPTLSFVVQILLLSTAGVLANDLVNKNRISGTYNLFPGAFLILVASFLPEFIQFSGIHFVLIILLLVVRQVFKMYRASNVTDHLVNIGLLIGAASLFYASGVVFLIWALFGINSMRSLYLKDTAALLIGFLLPYLFVGTWYFWNDNFDVFVAQQLKAALGFSGWLEATYPTLKIGWFAVLILVSLISYPYFSQRKTHAEGKKIDLLYGLMPVAGVAVFAQDQPGLSHLLLLSIPIGIILAFIFGSIKPRWGEFFHLLLLVIAFLLQYGLFLFPA
jgi:hypothetical protein